MRESVFNLFKKVIEWLITRGENKDTNISITHQAIATDINHPIKTKPRHKIIMTRLVF